MYCVSTHSKGDNEVFFFVESHELIMIGTFFLGYGRIMSLENQFTEKTIDWRQFGCWSENVSVVCLFFCVYEILHVVILKPHPGSTNVEDHTLEI